ncbi:MAG: GxxExxY protein [Phycisphaerae bacterium]
MGKTMDELTYAVIGAGMRVHRTLGPGFPEAVYHQAVCAEMQKRKIAFESEKAMEVYYGDVCCGTFRPDLVVEDRVIVELKALSDLVPEHTAQVLSYLKASGLKVALLLNFGAPSLQRKRVVL